MSVSYNIVIFAILSNKPILLNNITRLERGSAGFIWKVAFRAAFFFDLGNFSRCVVSGATHINFRKIPRRIA